MQRRFERYVVGDYLAYLAISLSVAVLVARTLSRNGRSFLAGAFGCDERMAGAANQLLVVGFCLINCGSVAKTIHEPGLEDTARSPVEMVPSKTGVALLILCGMPPAIWGLLHRCRQFAPSAPQPHLQYVRFAISDIM